MRNAYVNNIQGLRWANLVFFVLALLFSIFPIITEKAFVRAGFYLESAVIAFVIFCIACSQRKDLINRKPINNKFINLLIFLYYANVMFFGLYLAVWADPNKIAGSFIGIYICALFLFNIPFLIYFFLTVFILAIYITAIVNVKIPEVWNYDIQNACFAFILSLIFGWQIIMNRMVTASKERKLKNENAIDELTQLKNRRDFINTFQRFITTHRQSDNFLCVALVDIDRFKNYNDFYGHPKGDDCLRSIGKAFNDLCKSDNLYAARVGGEEFALLWHNEKFVDAEVIGLRINQTIRDLNIPHEKSDIAPFVTVSVGVHAAKFDTPHDTKELYDLADKALYAAKENGRNCLVVKS